MKRFHTRPAEARVLLIPADIDAPMEYKRVPLTLTGLRSLISDGYLEKVSTPLLPEVEGVRLVMVVDEDGHAKGLPFNARAAQYYPGPTGIVGDAYIIGEALVADEEMYYEPDFVGIPDNFEMIGVRG